MIHTLKGRMSDRAVWLDGKWLPPGPSQDIYNHSPDGFNWGYGGSGPAQLALAIQLKLTGRAAGYQKLKWQLIAELMQTDFDIHFNDSILDSAK